MADFKTPYDMFATDKAKEREGIRLNYSDVFYIEVARAGGANERYKKVLADKLLPYRRAIQLGTVTDEAAARLMREAAAEGLVLGWGSKAFGPDRIPGKDGKPIDFSVENVVKLFEDLPDLFDDVSEQAGDAKLFREAAIEVDAKN